MRKLSEKNNDNVGQSLRPIKKRTRDMEVMDALIEMIEDAGLKIGDRLPTEKELAMRLEVGRSTIREALKAWQGMGIITRNKGAGTILAAEVFSNSVFFPITLKLEAESLLRTHSVRAVLEMEVCKLAAIHATNSQRKIIAECIEELMNNYDKAYDWRSADLKFHSAISDACGNPLFGQMISQLHGAFHDIYSEPFGQPKLGQNSIPLHKELAQAVIKGDANEAGKVMKKISDLVKTEVMRVINEK